MSSFARLQSKQEETSACDAERESQRHKAPWRSWHGYKGRHDTKRKKEILGNARQAPWSSLE